MIGAARPSRGFPGEINKKPRASEAFLFSYPFKLPSYLARPEPGPVGVKVDPLGELLGANELPEGFMVLLEPPVAMPLVAEPVVPPVGLPLMDEPVVLPPMEEPPPETPPAEPPPLVLCASAKVLVSASAPANTIVVSFMAISFADDGIIAATGLCSGGGHHDAITTSCVLAK